METNPSVLICQVNNNESNVYKTIQEQVDIAIKKNKVDIIVLPECFNAPYDTTQFAKYAEPKGKSKTYSFLQDLAKKARAIVIGGSYITKNKDNYYNTCYVFNENGEELGVYDKIHLFDIDLPDRKYRESDVLSPGTKPLIVDTKFGKIGIGICFDIRFPKLAEYYREKGCSILCYPGAFTMKTGKDHYEVLLKGLALNNQCFVIGCAPARDEDASYVTWSNSTVINPWGDVLLICGHSECFKTCKIDKDYIGKVRSSIPIKDNFVYE